MYRLRTAKRVLLSLPGRNRCSASLSVLASAGPCSPRQASPPSLPPAILHSKESRILGRPLQWSCVIRRFSSGDLKGEDIYQQALEALKQVEVLREEREKQKAEELHRAIEKAEAKEKEHADNPKAKNLKGVTVVKTVVKQTRKERKNLKQEETKWERKAHDLLTQAAVTYGHPQASILLGNGALQKANRIWAEESDASLAKESIQQALDLYEKAGNNGAAEGWFNLGRLLWTGYPEEVEEDEAMDTEVFLASDTDASMNAFRKAIALGDPDAMYFVGVQQLSDETTTSDVLTEGLGFIESAAHMGHGPACYYLALMHLNGNEALDIAPCSSSEFVGYLNAATDMGDADALFLRGFSYHEGDNGYPLDYKLAFDDFIASAEAGNADAFVSAGAMLHQGRQGVAQNQSYAFDLYQRAGEMGSREGWRNVVACYALGEGVPKSEATANYIAKTMLQE